MLIGWRCELMHIGHYVYDLDVLHWIGLECLDVLHWIGLEWIEFVYEMLIGSRCELMHMGHYVYDLDVYGLEWLALVRVANYCIWNTTCIERCSFCYWKS